MSAIENKRIKFYNKMINGVVYKFGNSLINDPDISFVCKFKNLNTLNKILNDVNKIIAGRFNEIEDPDITNEYEIGTLTPTGVAFYDVEGQNIIGTLSLSDFKDMLEGWIAFLNTPPLEGSKP
jgi:hypothetical protein